MFAFVVSHLCFDPLRSNSLGEIGVDHGLRRECEVSEIRYGYGELALHSHRLIRTTELRRKGSLANPSPKDNVTLTHLAELVTLITELPGRLYKLRSMWRL
jgi:hypothetical protein